MELVLGRHLLSNPSKARSGIVRCPTTVPHQLLIFGGLQAGRVLCCDLASARRDATLKVPGFKTEVASLAIRSTSATQDLAPGYGLLRYRFVVPQYVTTFGQTLRVVGSLPELGAWEPQHAPTMTWSESHQWSLDCALPQRSFEFKITVLEGHGVRWEGGSNRVVQAENEEDDVPVEIVVWLTCHFDATTTTQLQLAVPRACIQDAYETGSATLEFLKLRKSRTARLTERRQQVGELVGLTEAVAEQSTLLHQLSDWLGHEVASGQRGGSHGDETCSEDVHNQLLLLAIDSVKLPKTLRRISFVQSWATGPAALPAPSTDGAASKTAAPSLFLRGELDNRAQDLITSAEDLLQERTSSAGAPHASLDWASLAQEAGQVAGALEALGGGDSPAGQATQLQLRGLASVGNAMAGSSSSIVLERGVIAPEEGDGAGDAEIDLLMPAKLVVVADVAMEAKASADDVVHMELPSLVLVDQALDTPLALRLDAGSLLDSDTVELDGRAQSAEYHTDTADTNLQMSGAPVLQQAAPPPEAALLGLASSLKGSLAGVGPLAERAQNLGGADGGLLPPSISLERQQQKSTDAADRRGLARLLSDLRAFLKTLFPW